MPSLYYFSIYLMSMVCVLYLQGRCVCVCVVFCVNKEIMKQSKNDSSMLNLKPKSNNTIYQLLLINSHTWGVAYAGSTKRSTCVTKFPKNEFLIN